MRALQVHAFAPRCAIDVWDGSLVGRRARIGKRLPRLDGRLTFLAHHMGPTTWKRYAGRRVSLLKVDRGATHDAQLPVHSGAHGTQLKRPHSVLSALTQATASRVLQVDCEGCEFEALAPWLAHVCTDQLLIEVHGCACNYCALPAPNDTVLASAAPLNRTDTYWRYRRYRQLMELLDQEYDLFLAVPNSKFSDGSCCAAVYMAVCVVQLYLCTAVGRAH